MKLIAAATSSRASATVVCGDHFADQVDPHRLAVGLISQVAVAHFVRGVRQFGDAHGNEIRSVQTDPDMALDKPVQTLRRLLIRA